MINTNKHIYILVSETYSKKNRVENDGESEDEYENVEIQVNNNDLKDSTIVVDGPSSSSSIPSIPSVLVNSALLRVIEKGIKWFVFLFQTKF